MVSPIAPAAPPPIAASAVEQFHRDGYCIVPGLYEPSEIDAIEAFFEDFRTRGIAAFDKGLHYGEIDPTKQQLRAMHPHRHAVRVQQWALQPRVMEALAVLLGRPALLAQTMYYFKPPGAKGQGMHQDNFYLLAAPATCIAAWTPIDDATVDNGCLVVVPGSHRKDILCPAEGDSWNSYGDTHIKPFPRDARTVAVEVPRGATLFFGGNLIHGSGPNRTTDRARRTFIGHYIDEASDQVARFYHPVLDAHGNTVSRVRIPEGGGPCSDGWQGAQH